MLAKIRSVSRGFFFPSWSIPIALLGLTLLSYGLRARSLGFYWDDWPYLWFFHRFGPQGIIDAFSGDRPFLSFIYTLSLTVFGNSSQGWQIFGLLARWLCGWGLWWALAQAWPRHAHKAAWAAALFTVYPGFTQQWIAVIYGQAFFLFAQVFFSIGLTLWLARRRQALKRGWLAAGTLLALALSAFTMFSTEYFFGLELLRPMLLWIVFAGQLSGQFRDRRAALLGQARQVFLWWAPYLALMTGFVFWRMLLHPFTGYQVTALEGADTSPLGTLLRLALTVLQDLVVGSLAAWGQPLQHLSGFLDRGTGSGLRLLMVILVTGTLAALYFARLRPRSNGASPDAASADVGGPEKPWALQAVAVGILAVLAAGVPTWATGLPMRMGFPQDRYALAISVGISLIIAGVIDALGKSLLRKAAVLALAVALAAGFHFDTALNYDLDWESTRNFFWQLTWRAPSVKPNTLFASIQMPFRYYEDDSLSAPLNWTYDPNGQSKQMAYILYDLEVRKNSMPAEIKPDQPVEHGFRAAEFSGSTSQVLLFYYKPPGCVHILDPRYDAQLYRLPDRLLQVMPLSNPAAVITDQPAAVPPAEIFGSEPKHRWCYFYQKAELARQNGDWEAIYQLGKQSIRKGFRPDDAVEYLPFVEGYAHLGKMDDAFELSLSAVGDEPALSPALCSIWQRALAEHPDAPRRHRNRVNRSFNCSLP